MSLVEIKVPDIGDFKEVEVIELLVKVGDTVKLDQSLITVESDKASMEIPCNMAGVVKELKVKIGDKVAEGSVVLMLEVQASTVSAAPQTAPAATTATTTSAAAVQVNAQATSQTTTQATPAPQASLFEGQADIECDTLVLGAGPGGYTAAFRAADLGPKSCIGRALSHFRWSLFECRLYSL